MWMSLVTKYYSWDLGLLMYDTSSVLRILDVFSIIYAFALFLWSINLGILKEFFPFSFNFPSCS